MISIFQASYEFRDEVKECINQNYDLYQNIVDPTDLSEHQVDDEWAERNFRIRKFYLMKDKSEYVGMGSYQNLGPFAYVGYFYIRPKFHRKGYGQKLMQFLETQAKTEHLKFIQLFANSKAQWAINFYHKIGFTTFKTQKSRYSFV